MKRASSYLLALFLATGLAFAQTGGGAGKASTELNPQPLPPGKKMQAKSKTDASSKDAHKAAKKSKKGSSTNNGTTAPK